MSTDLVETSNQEIDISGVVIRHEDGSFSIDGKRYLPEVKCSIDEIVINFHGSFDKFKDRSNFDINNFKFEINQDGVSHVKVRIKDFGFEDNYGQTSRNVARQHVVRREKQYYLKIDIVEISYQRKRIQCKCMSSFSEDFGGIPDKVALSTSLDQFYCIGNTDPDPTIEMLQSAISTINAAGYGSLPGRWYHDSDLNMVRSFNPKTKTAIGMMRPIEALQIASQLNKKGDWDAMQRFDMALKNSDKPITIESK